METEQAQMNRKLSQWLRVLSVIALCQLAALAYLNYWQPQELTQPPFEEPVPAEEVEAVVGEVMPESVPVRLRLPAVGIDTTFEGGLGLNEDKSPEVPETYTEVGWYKYGPTPGELGPSVILGHVDSYQGPAVFWPLGKLKEGDEIFVDREDGSTARFVVTEVKRVDQDEFPTREVYGDIDHAGLRLITCTGTYNHGIQRYSHNLIIYARLENQPGGVEESQQSAGSVVE